MTDIETTENVFEAKARQIFEKIMTISDVISVGHRVTVTCERKKLVSAIASALEAERLEERERCAKIVDDNADRYTELLAKQADKPQDFATYAGDLTIASLHGACSRIATAIRNRGETK